MAALTTTYGFRFAQPGWLLEAVLVIPVIWLGMRSLGQLGRTRRIFSIVVRTVVVALLAVIMARPEVTRTNKRITLIAVIDRSQSVPQRLQKATFAYRAERLLDKPAED